MIALILFLVGVACIGILIYRKATQKEEFNMYAGANSLLSILGVILPLFLLIPLIFGGIVGNNLKDELDSKLIEIEYYETTVKSNSFLIGIPDTYKIETINKYQDAVNKYNEVYESTVSRTESLMWGLTDRYYLSFIKDYSPYVDVFHRETFTAKKLPTTDDFKVMPL